MIDPRVTTYGHICAKEGQQVCACPLASLQERFREKFANSDPHLRNWMQDAVRIKDVLAFIAEELVPSCDVAYESGRKFERAEERQRITSLIEGMRKPFNGHQRSYGIALDSGHNQALDDILEKISMVRRICSGHLIGDILTPPHSGECGSGIQEETECCKKCNISSLLRDHLKCSCHKPRTEFPQGTDAPVTSEGKEPLGGDSPCSNCGVEDNVCWFTENVFWNAVMGADDWGADKMYDERGKILCIPCFVRCAMKKYDVKKWRFLPDWAWREKKDKTN